MLKIRHVVIVLGMMLCPAASYAQVSIGIMLSNVSIGINLPAYPELAPIPGYPVYYAPRLAANYFFYDGMYWVYQDDNWYESSWYNGPWWLVDPAVVPVFILRIPVRYYRRPPMYFHGWRADAPPRWGDRWGRDWEQQRRGWDRWNRGSAPALAPLPSYQRQYYGDRYPRQMEQQHELQQRNYRYQPRDPVVRQQYQEQEMRRAPARHGTPQQRNRGAPVERDNIQRSAPPQQNVPAAPRVESPQRGGSDFQRPAPQRPKDEDRGRQQPGLNQRKDEGRESKPGQTEDRRQGQDQGRNRNE